MGNAQQRMIDVGSLYWLDDYAAPNGCRMVRKTRGGWSQTWCETCGEKLMSGKPGNGAGIRYLRHHATEAFFKHVAQKASA